MRIIYFKKDEKHVLGRAGENGATRITVDVAAWAAEYPSGTGALIYKRPDGQVYPLTTALDGINDRLIDGDAAKSRLSALAQSLGVDAYGLTDRIAALNAKAGDMDGIAALVGNISNTAYKLLPSGLRALLDKYRT